MKKHYVVLTTSLFFVIFLATISASFAQTNRSIGTQWTTPGHWSRGTIPVAAEDIIIDSDMTLNATATVKTLTVNAGRTLSFGNNTSARVLTVTSDVTVNGTINVAAFNATHSLSVGGALTNTGTLNLYNNANRRCNLTVNGNSISGNGSFNLYSLTIGGPVVNSSTSQIDMMGNMILNNALNCSAGTFNFMLGAAQGISGTSNPNFNNLSVAGATPVTVSGITAVTVNGNLTTGGTSTFTLSGATTNLTVNGDFAMNNTSTFDFGTTTARTVTVNGDFTPKTITMTGAGLAHQLILKGTNNNNPTTFTTTLSSGSVVEYGASGDQSIFGSTGYQSIKITNGGIKTLKGHVTMSSAGVLTLTSGVVELDNYNLTINNVGSAAIAGGPFSASNMIATEGAGFLIKQVTSAQALNPIGAGGYYSPMTLSSISAGGTTYSIRAVPVALNPAYINVYWDFQSSAGKTITATFQYDPAQQNGATQVIAYTPSPYTVVQRPPTSGTSSFGTNSFTITGNTTATIGGYWTMGSATYYSYQTGSWDDPTTWTSDPSGTLQVGTTIPGANDAVVILTGRTVTLATDVAPAVGTLSIENAAFLDMSTLRFTGGITVLGGEGTLRLASVNFPTVTTNNLVAAGGGTVEYYNAASFNLPAAQTTYNNLTINSSGQIATQLINLTLNGNLLVKSGTFRINDNTSARRQLTVNGNVTVNSGASIAVGSGITNTTTNPAGIGTTVAGPFIEYYDNQSHRVVINGDFINNGTANFNNLANPVYSAFPSIAIAGPTTGFATVYFRGSSNNVLICNGVTNFYNLILDKGSDQTFSLTVTSSAYNNFKLHGANAAAADASAGATATNPNVKKALWIRNGTLVLQGSLIIPSLSEGATTAALPATSDYFIPANGALNINGADVVVLGTVDDYREVNAAYGLSGGSNAAYGVGIGGYSSIYVYGKLQVSDGYLSTRESGGIITNGGSGQVVINGGVVDAKQFLNSTSSTASFQMTGGTFSLRGRFKRLPASYSGVASLTDNNTATINTVRATNGIDATVGTFNLNNTGNIFNMSGGDIVIYDVTDATNQFAFDVKSSTANISVTGGTLTIAPRTGTVTADAANYLISSNAPLANLIVNRASSTSVAELATSYPLTVLSNVDIQAGQLDANAQDLTIGGNFTIANGATYTAIGASANTTTFNGSGAQTFTVNTAGALDLNNLTITKTAGVALNFAGSQTSINVAGALNLTLGTLNDNGTSIFVKGNVYNSGVHTGTGKISLNGTAVQSIDGNGTFQNLELNNTNAAAAPVSLAANTTINGSLTLSQNKLFNISTYNLKFNGSATVVNAGTNRYIQTAGTAGDGGITKVYTSPTAFVFPLGAASTSRVGTPAYTPASIGLSAAPTAYGSITINPVGYAHPNATTTGRSLTYFWRVKSSGFTLGSATITHGYTYSVTDVVTGGGGTIAENSYVAARWNVTTAVWTKGTTSDLDITNKIIGQPTPGSFLKNVTFIDGDYTAGDDTPTDPFGTPKIFYSWQSGDWKTASTWTTDATRTTQILNGVPGASDVVHIGAGHTVTAATPGSLTTINTDPLACATLYIDANSILDNRYNPASNFGIVMNSPLGNGKIRITTSYTSGSTFANPSGDFSSFNTSLGTTELYSTNNTAGATYWMANGVATYGNLLFTPLGSSNIIFPNNDVLIYGNCTATGTVPGSWLVPSWNTAYPTAPTATVAKTITINGNMDIQGGSFGWYGNGAVAQNVVVKGDITICTNCALGVFGSATNQTLTIGGSLINNGNGSTSGGVVGATLTNVPVTFNGNANASVTNTTGTPTTVFGKVTVNKGSSQATTLNINIGGTFTTPTDNWLTLQNGTLQYQRVNPATDFTISTTNNLSIPATAGLYINYSNSGSKNVLIANSSNDAADLLLSGKLTVVSGNVYVGPTSFPAFNNDIEYTGNTAAIQVDGGNLYVNGQIRRSTASTNGALTYTQSGGAVSINGQTASSATSNTRAKLEVLNAGSAFNMSGGTITIVRGGGTTFGDLYIRPTASTVTGGTITFTNAVPNTLQAYTMDAAVSLNNLTITGGASQNATVTLMTNPLTLKGSLTLSNARSLFVANNRNVTINQNLVNNASTAAYAYGTNTTTFSGASQNISGSAVTDFYDLVVAPSLSLTVSNSFTVNRNLTISSGNLLLNTAKVSVKSNGSFINNGSYSDDNVSGGVSMNGTAKQEVSGTGSFQRLEINNSQGVSLLNDITLDHNLVMTSGLFDIKSNNLILNTTSNITGAPFSVTKMITTDGVATALGLTKFFPSIASTTNFTYPVGSASKYTPAVLTINANAAIGYIKVAPVNTYQPTVSDPTKVLDYYYSIASSGISGFSGSFVLNYSGADVNGSEPDYVAAWLQLPGTYWSKAAVGSGTDNVNEFTHQITFNYPAGSSNLNGDYTAGEDAAIPSQIPTYVSNKNGNWSDNTIWTPVGTSPPCPAGGPNGYNVIIRHTVTTTVNYCFAYTTVIEGTGKLSIQAGTFGHNFGTVDGDPTLGTGTVYMQGANLPAGNFSPFLDCTGNGTVEYGGTGAYTMVLNGFTSIPNLTLSGTGTRILPDDDLTICNVLKIDGPTLDNSVSNRKLTIDGSMERYSTGAFNAGSGSNATVSFAGTAAQSVGGATGNFSGTNAFYNLEVNNASGLAVGASGTIEVNGTLSLTNGIVSTGSTNSLSILNTSPSAVVPSGGSTTSYVDGPLKKQILNGGAFVYPLGAGSVKGHTFTLTSTTAGSSLYTAQYFTPNPTYASVTAPIIDVNTAEFWGVTTTAAKTAKVDIAWDAQSDINGAMTANGISDLRVVEYNTGSSSWVAQASTASGTPTLGDVQTTGNVNLSTTAKNYSIGSITTTKPIAVLSPTGAVCGTAGIPVTFTVHSPITLNYTISYKFNGVAQTPIVVTSLPFTLPTPSPGTYELTGFLYNNSTLTGVVDNTVVTAYASPTTSAAGADQSICNATSLNLVGNQPTTGTGLWTIVSGTGGWFNTPDASNYNALFGGPPGRTYTLRWTITNGACKSTDDVVISFPYSPQQPTGFTAAPSSVCQGSTGNVYTVPAVTGATSYVWTYSGTGATFVGSGNSITVNFSATATSGNIGVAAVNGCGTGTARTTAVTVVVPAVATFSYTGTPYCPAGANPSPTFSGGGVAGTFSSTAGLVFVSTATGQVNLAASTPGTYTVTNTIPAASPCGVITATSTITISQVGNWVGNVSGNWSDPNNWLCSTIPTTAIDVIIPSSAPNMPVVNAAGAVCKSITINSGASLTISGTNTLNVYGGWSNAGTFTANNGTVVFNTTGTVGGAATTTFNHVTISSGVTLTAPSGNVNVTGNWTNNGTFTASTGTVTFTGTTANTVTGSTSFYNLVMSKTGVNTTLSGTATTTVTNALTLTSGNIVTSSTHKLALTNAATTTGASAASFVSGPMTKVLAASGTFSFPLGSVTTGNYRPAVISATSGADTWTGEYVGDDPTNGGYDHKVFNTTNMQKVSQFEYWLISRAGSTSASLTLAYNTGSYLGGNIGNLPNLMIARWNGSSWDLPPGGGTFSQSGTNVAGTTTVTNVTSFSPFTHSSKDNTSPLPIKLLYFNATAQSASVYTEWATSQEVDNDYFTVEKSADGETFKEVARVEAKGDGRSAQKYSLQDYDPFPGLSYYRLKQTDVDGKYTYSKVVSVSYDGNGGGIAFSTYPNPFSGRKIIVEIKGLASNSNMPIQIVDLMGRTLLEKVLTTNNSGAVREELVLDRELPSGVYIIKAGPSLRFTHKIEVN